MTRSYTEEAIENSYNENIEIDAECDPIKVYAYLAGMIIILLLLIVYIYNLIDLLKITYKN
jgi:hypothetical protein